LLRGGNIRIINVDSFPDFDRIPPPVFINGHTQV
jgi:hypothetical protein